MSDVADFATTLQKAFPIEVRSLYPETSIKGSYESLSGIRVVIFDVYGTLVDYWLDAYNSENSKKDILLAAFAKTADFFSMTETVLEIDSSKKPEETLFDFYNGLISMGHSEAKRLGKRYPEIQIDEIWGVIVSILENNGYKISDNHEGDRKSFLRFIAYYYNFFALGRGFFPGVVRALESLKSDNIELGILSNAQFYTPLDLSLFVREQSENCVDYLEFFEEDYCYFSYEYGLAKPHEFFYDKILQALRMEDISPREVLFVGNDLLHDIEAAQKAGFRTALFTGRKSSTFLHESSHRVQPDLVFSDFSELPKVVSFHGIEE